MGFCNSLVMLNYSLVILIMNVRKCSLLRRSLHLVSSSNHQAVHHIDRVVHSTFQHKSEKIVIYYFLKIFCQVQSKIRYLLGAVSHLEQAFVVWVVCLILPYLPSELSSIHGGSQPMYRCSRTCRSPWSRP